jgi:hypothetical protein
LKWRDFWILKNQNFQFAQRVVSGKGRGLKSKNFWANDFVFERLRRLRLFGVLKLFNVCYVLNVFYNLMLAVVFLKILFSLSLYVSKPFIE